MRCLLKIIPLVLIISWMVGCKPGMPSNIIEPDDMEEILYDYHLADGMAMADGNYENASYLRTVYRDAALRKHGVTQADFDSSLVYYYRHTERLYEIYENLAKRLNDESVNLGSTANEMSQLGGEVGQGDTTTVWTYPQTVVMLPVSPYNVLSFSVKADTSYHAGDKIIFNVDAQFIFQDGVRDGTVMLAVTFRNDSVATQIMHMSSNQRYILQVADPQQIGVKDAKGFIYLTSGTSNNSSTLKMMCLRNLRLLKMKYKEEAEKTDKTTMSSNGFAPPMGASSGGTPPQTSPTASGASSDTASSLHQGERAVMRPMDDNTSKTAPRAPSARKFP
ncbi:MAG: DUF4296 domain-containing protein [Prevotella sp.]|nr:DUF4296 domain-containing protein [Prevotella sp.]